MDPHFYEQYSNQAFYRYTAARAREAIAEKAKQGEAFGPAPIGYLNVSTDEGKRVEIDPQLAPLVKEAFQKATRVRTSLRKIVRELAPKGLISDDGKPMSKTGLHKMLTNPFYVGEVRYKGQRFPGIHPPLVSQKLFDQVQERLTQRCKRGFQPQQAVVDNAQSQT